MLELIFTVLIYTVPQATGRGVVFVVTLGQVWCEDGWAEAIGILFWVAVFLAASLVLVRV